MERGEGCSFLGFNDCGITFAKAPDIPRDCYHPARESAGASAGEAWAGPVGPFCLRLCAAAVQIAAIGSAATAACIGLWSYWAPEG